MYLWLRRPVDIASTTDMILVGDSISSASISHASWVACVATLVSVAALASCGGDGGPVSPLCNNGALDEGELCDGALVGANTCQSAGYERGVLVCNRRCTNFDYTGCSGGDGDTIGGDTTGDADTTSSSGAPVFLSLSANTSALNAGSSLIVTAVLTDPDGIDDLIGGNLEDPSSGASYGAFATAASEGSYTLTLTWADLHVLAPIEAAPAGRERTFRAVFFDVGGGRVERSFTVTLRCDADLDRWVCDGECADVATDSDHCGACGEQLPNQVSIGCRDGAPYCHQAPNLTLCDEQCLDLATDALACGACDNDCGTSPAWPIAEFAGCAEAACVFAHEVTEAINAGATCEIECRARGLVCHPGGEPPGSGTLTQGGSTTLACDEQLASHREVQIAHCRCALGPGGGAAITPIESIQASSASTECAASGDQTIGEPITIEGVVAVGRFSVNAGLDGYFVATGTAAARSGLQVVFPSAQTHDFTPGQRVQITGTHHEYFCQTRLVATAVTSVGSQDPPEPIAVASPLTATAAEAWEGSLVSLYDLEVTGHTSFGEAETSAGVLIDDTLMGASFERPAIGTRLWRLTGVVVFAFDRHRVAPRQAADMSVALD